MKQVSITEFIAFWKKKVNTCSEEQLLKLYNHTWTLSFCGKSIKIPFCAQSYNMFIDLLENNYDLLNEICEVLSQDGNKAKLDG